MGPLFFHYSGSRQGSNLLDKFYRDPTRWAFTFQTYAFLSRTQAAVSQLRAGDEDAAAGGGAPPNYVFERSLYSDKHCFATNCYKVPRPQPVPPFLVPPSYSKTGLFTGNVSAMAALPCLQTGLFDEIEWRVYSDYHAFIMAENPCLVWGQEGGESYWLL